MIVPQWGIGGTLFGDRGMGEGGEWRKGGEGEEIEGRGEKTTLWGMEGKRVKIRGDWRVDKNSKKCTGRVKVGEE